MSVVGFHASHELFPPGELLRLAVRAGQAGFDAGMCSDHFHPWVPTQGQAGFSWSWLGAALQATALPWGTVCCPAGRYHPAVVAQAAATLAEMFPGRFWLALGTGQALNERVTGEPWPPKPERRARVEEAAGVIRGLWAGETVTHEGRVRVREARLYTRPAAPPALLGAAVTEETALWVGGWADGLLTVGKEPDELRNTVAAFRAGGGAGKPVYVQAAVAFGPDEASALAAAKARWPVAVLDVPQLEDLPTPEDFARAAAVARTGDYRGKVRTSDSVARHAEWVAGDFAAGADAVYLHHVGDDPDRFLDVFGSEVLPRVRAGG